MELKNKTALITGATGGLGKAIARHLASENVNLILLGRDEERLEGVTNVQMRLCDLSNIEQVENVIKNITSQVDIVINCAGVWKKSKPTEGIKYSEKKEMLAVNYLAPQKIIELLLPKLKEQNEAAIVNIISRSAIPDKELEEAGFKPKPPSVYSKTKIELRQFTNELKDKLKNTSVQVAGVYPGGIKTDFHEKGGDKRKGTERYEKYIETRDLADAIVEALSFPDLKDVKMFGDKDSLRFV